VIGYGGVTKGGYLFDGGEVLGIFILKKNLLLTKWKK